MQHRRWGWALASALVLGGCYGGGDSGGSGGSGGGSSPEQDQEDNNEPIDWGECGHSAVGEDEPDQVLDRGKEAWPQDVVHNADGTVSTSFGTLYPMGWPQFDPNGHGVYIGEFCTRRTNYYRAIEGLEPYVRYVEKEICAAQEAHDALEAGQTHLTLCGQDTQNAIGGEWSGDTGFNWLPALNWDEAQSQGGHYGAQTWTEPRYMACSRFGSGEAADDAGGRSMQDFWDDVPPARLTGAEEGFFADTEPPAAGSLVAVDMAVGGHHTCALLEDGTIRCWGDGLWGQLGDGSVTPTEDQPGLLWYHGRSVPSSPVSLPAQATAVAAGHNHTCALLEDASVYCWGHDDRTQLGLWSHKGHIRQFDEHYEYAPEQVPQLPQDDPVVGIAAAMAATCLTFESGTVRCFGWAHGGVTGRAPDNDSYWGAFGASNNGEDSETLVGLREIVLGSSHGCARTEQGGAKCWGWDWRGQLGDGVREELYHAQVSANAEDDVQTDDDPRIPRDVVGMKGGVAMVQVGAEHSCAILDNGAVRCWGSNRHEQLGHRGDYPQGEMWEVPAPEHEATPVDVCLDRPAVDLALGGAHSCALLDDGMVRCWGSANHGKLGHGHYVKDRVEPALVEGLEDVVQIESRHMHTCARTGDGKIYCWGLNYYGQLGTGESTDQATPQLVTGF